MDKKRDICLLPIGCDDETTAGAALSLSIELAFNLKVGNLGKGKISEIIESERLETKRDFIRHEFGSIKNAQAYLHKLANNQNKQQSRLPKSVDKLSTNEKRLAILEVRQLKENNKARSDEDIYKKVGKKYGVTSRTMRRYMDKLR